MPTATAPDMKRGSAVLAKATNRSASTRLQSRCRRKSPVTLAPRGYPETNPIATAKAAVPGRRKRGRIKGSRQTPRKWTAPNPISTWAMTKKGRSDGRTTSNQRRRPSREASKALRGAGRRECHPKPETAAVAGGFEGGPGEGDHRAGKAHTARRSGVSHPAGGKGVGWGGHWTGPPPLRRLVGGRRVPFLMRPGRAPDRGGVFRSFP